MKMISNVVMIKTAYRIIAIIISVFIIMTITAMEIIVTAIIINGIVKVLKI